MNPYTFEVKRTPRGKYYCIVSIGTDVIYVSRKVYDTGEEASSEARQHLETIWKNNYQKRSNSHEKSICSDQ